MIRVSVLYPTGEGSHFDFQYYQTKHIPMVRQKLGSALKRSGIEKGLGTAEPGKPAPFIASCFFEFESVASFQASFGPHVQAIMKDIPNYTNVQPVIQIAEIIE